MAHWHEQVMLSLNPDSTAMPKPSLHLTFARRLRRLARAQVSSNVETADELGMPEDPEFRSALVGYLEWGSRLAVINSQPGASVDQNAPMPKWGWGEVGGPYKG